ncbi:hypothetical protein BO94DRAFT_587243 [Aspergillus sclerotioniger CBS 115572]|uniref:Uncharacterized protein n=1 Tax=Aspergillus sclerotioniger CBS 115572 TaxID=1450535 RepID=A0A317W8G7_9EURO|nr:hypothetical protein BO94DRAFT_587243 [Aspergillus sclerotioniger CBS 115572]PWY81532.1 hypothetical protein BO94DRAFT_587243 [Aspergillus sclerotioniger CBS 115572]
MRNGFWGTQGQMLSCAKRPDLSRMDRRLLRNRRRLAGTRRAAKSRQTPQPMPSGPSNRIGHRNPHWAEQLDCQGSLDRARREAECAIAEDQSSQAPLPDCERGVIMAMSNGQWDREDRAPRTSSPVHQKHAQVFDNPSNPFLCCAFVEGNIGSNSLARVEILACHP